MDSEDFGIKISREEVDATTASAEDLLMSSRYPFAKLDRTNDASFSNISLTFNNNPPEPAGSPGNTELRTLVYQYPHGYDYVPATWALFNVVTSPSPNYTPYATSGGIIASNGAFDAATLEVGADNTNINIYVKKYLDTGAGGTANNITTARIRIRVYVFVEDVGV